MSTGKKVYWGTPAALRAGANPSMLLLGDSWFWYPLGNLPTYIHESFSEHDQLVIGRNGAEAQDWSSKHRKDIDYAFKMYASGVQALLLSGGGNDIAGSADFLRVLRDDCSGAASVADCYGPGQPAALMSKIAAAYREVVLKFRAYNRQATVFMHNYDHAWPTGDGLFGPADWLKRPMDHAKVPEALRRPLFRDLVEKLRDAQLALATEAGLGPMVAVLTAGTLPEDENWWANELHPTPKGFKRIAKRALVPAIRTVIPA